eukprot:5952547-Alexandrium_andersonii.AAC.1
MSPSSFDDALMAHTEDGCSPHTHMDLVPLSDGDFGASEGEAHVATVNATALSGLKRYMLATRAHVVLVQEHHVVASQIEQESQWLLKK